MTDPAGLSAEQLAAAIQTADYVRKALTEKGFKFGPRYSGGVERLSFKGSMFEIDTTIFCGDTYITLQTYLPLIIPAPAADVALRYLNELNLKQPLGSYELNSTSNKISFKSGISIPPLPDPDVLERLLVWSVTSIDLISAWAAEIAKPTASSTNEISATG